MKHNFIKNPLLILSSFLIVFNTVGFELHSFLDPLSIEKNISEDDCFATTDVTIICCKANCSLAKKELTTSIEKFKNNHVSFMKTSQNVTRTPENSSGPMIFFISSLFSIPLRI